MRYYRKTWQNFLDSQRTLATEKRDYTEWHRGRPKFAVWGITVDSGPVVERLNEVREHLAPFLIEEYNRDAHITLYACGFMAEHVQSPDDYDGYLLDRHLEAITILKLRPFVLHVLGVNSFESAPFLEVADPNRMLGRIRDALISVRDEDRQSAYTPHITVGLYSDSFPCSALDSVIGGMGKREPLEQHVQCIALMAYDTRNVGSPLMVVHEIRL